MFTLTSTSRPRKLDKGADEMGANRQHVAKLNSLSKVTHQQQSSSHRNYDYTDLQVDNEGMLDFLQNILLASDVLDLLESHNLSDGHDFQRKPLVTPWTGPYQAHTTECPCAWNRRTNSTEGHWCHYVTIQKNALTPNQRFQMG